MKSLLMKLLAVSRPVSWPNTAYPFAATYIVLNGAIDARLIVGTLFFLIPYNLVMYGVNDVFDYESDMLNPRKGGIEGAKAAKRWHRPILFACAVSAIPLFLTLAAMSDLASFAVLSLVMFFVLAYSVPVLRLKERPVLDSFTSSAHFAGPMLYAAALSAFPSSVWPYFAAFFLWGMASHAFGAVQDIIPDRQGGIASIATIFGAKLTTRLSVLFYLLCSAILISLGQSGVIVSLVALSYAVNILPYVSVADKESGITNIAWRRFIYLNYLAGFIVTMVIINSFI